MNIRQKNMHIPLLYTVLGKFPSGQFPLVNSPDQIPPNLTLTQTLTLTQLGIHQGALSGHCYILSSI